MQREIYLLAADPEANANLAVLVEGRLGFRATMLSAKNLGGAVRRITLERPCLLVVDKELSDTFGGVHVLAALRDAGCRVPVVMIADDGDPTAMAAALELTADDYVTRPYCPDEILARIRAVLRRSDRAEGCRVAGAVRVDDEDFSLGGCIVRPRQMMLVSRSGEETRITPYQVAVAKELAANQGEVVTRDHLISRVWGSEVSPKSRTLDQTICDLKKRMGCGSCTGTGHCFCIQSVKGVGYRYIALEDSAKIERRSVVAA